MGRIHTTHTLNAYTQHIHIHSTCRQMQRSQAVHRIRIIYHASYTITPTRTYRHLPEMGCDQYHFNTTIHLRGKALHRICWIEGTGGLLVGLPSHTHSRSSLTIVGVQFTRCICVCVCVFVCVRARACVRACVRVRVYTRKNILDFLHSLALANIVSSSSFFIIVHTHVCTYSHICTDIYVDICTHIYRLP